MFHREPMLEKAILDAPDDDGCWRVYVDWLMERGDDVLGDDTLPGWVEVLETKHGFVTAARVRNGFAPLPPDVESALRQLVELPRLRFLQRLQLQPLAFEHEALAMDRANDALQRVELPSVRRLELGPFILWHGPEPASLDTAGWKLPRLEHRPQGSLRFVRDLWLEVEGQRLLLEAPPWRASPEHVGTGTTVNGCAVGAIYLVEGDVLRHGDAVAVVRADRAD